jgi:hypothetical protein
VICKRRTTGNLTKSKIAPNKAAAPGVSAATQGHKGVMAVLLIARVEAISRSQTREAISQRLGREDRPWVR